MAAFLFTCPNASMKVQLWLDDEYSDDSQYEALTCPACSKVHFVNAKTGKLFNEQSRLRSDGNHVRLR